MYGIHWKGQSGEVRESLVYKACGIQNENERDNHVIHCFFINFSPSIRIDIIIFHLVTPQPHGN